MWDPATGIPDLNSKVAIVTGAKYVSLQGFETETVNLFLG